MSKHKYIVGPIELETGTFNPGDPVHYVGSSYGNHYLKRGFYVGYYVEMRSLPTGKMIDAKGGWDPTTRKYNPELAVQRPEYKEQEFKIPAIHTTGKWNSNHTYYARLPLRLMFKA